MIVNYQVVLDLYTQIFMFGFPIAILMLICEKLLEIMQKFILGKRISL